MDFTIKISAEEEKALLTDMVSIQTWIENAIHNKARQCIDNVVKEYSDKQPEKISVVEKSSIVSTVNPKTAVKKAAEILSASKMQTNSK